MEVTKAAQGVAVSVNGAQAPPLSWADGWKLRLGPTILVFERPDSTGRTGVLRYDTGGGHYVLRCQ